MDPSAHSHRICSQRLQVAEDFITQQINEGHLPGAVTTVWHAGELIHHQAHGWADIEREELLSDRHLFRIYSLTKIVTSVAVLQLYERGLLDLNDPVAQYIPAFEKQQIELPDGRLVPANKATTIYDLLRHCGGLRNAHGIEELIASKRTLETFANELAALPLTAEPDTKWIYGYSTDVLARVIEIVSGRRFDHYLDAQIFRPLEMFDTAFALSEEQEKRLCSLYRLPESGKLIKMEDNGPDRVLGRNSSFLSGSAGLIASPMDYLRFATMLLQQGRLGDIQILSPKTVELMTLNHLPPEHPLLEIGTQRFGFGLGVSTMTDLVAARSLSSLGEFGWGGAAGTQVWINPEESLIAQIFIQVRADMPTGIMNIYKRLVYQALV
jgi:CubicO group peptidase (beta-lactamase class C family)